MTRRVIWSQVTDEPVFFSTLNTDASTDVVRAVPRLVGARTVNSLALLKTDVL